MVLLRGAKDGGVFGCDEGVSVKVMVMVECPCFEIRVASQRQSRSLGKEEFVPINSIHRVIVYNTT